MAATWIEVNGLQKTVIKIADYMELADYCAGEARLGNHDDKLRLMWRNALDAVRRHRSALQHMLADESALAENVDAILLNVNGILEAQEEDYDA